MKSLSLKILLCLFLLGFVQLQANAQFMNNGDFLNVLSLSSAKLQKPSGKMKIYHDPDADFKQRRGQTHNRKYLKEKLASLHLNIDSLQDRVDYLNRDTKAKEWEYQISTMKGSEGKILPFYKSHRNADGTEGRTIYGDERRRMPQR